MCGIKVISFSTMMNVEKTSDMDLTLEAEEGRRKVEISPFRPGVHDPLEIARTHLDIRRWMEEVGQNTFSDILDSQPDLQNLEDYYIEPGGNFFVAEDPKTGELIGFIGFRKDGNGHGFIKRLAVTEKHRRKGVATSLTLAALEWGKANGFSHIDAVTNIGEQALPIYLRFGFKVVGFDEESEDWDLTFELNGQLEPSSD